MECASCGFDNDPSAVVCVCCDAPLTPAPADRPPPGEEPTRPLGPPREEPTRPLGPPGGPARPLGPPPGEGAWRSSSLPLVAAGVVVLLLVVVIGVLVAGRSGDTDRDTVADPDPAIVLTTVPATEATTQTPTAPPTGTVPPTSTVPPAPTDEPAASAPEQAAAIDALLDRSVASRRKLNSAIDRVSRCTDLDGALADMREVGVERGEQMSEVNAADLSELGNGETLRTALSTALGHSLDADQHFVAWALPAAGGDCGGSATRDAAWDRGQASSGLAQAAKKEFLAAWNPVAVPLGFPARSNQDI